MTVWDFEAVNHRRSMMTVTRCFNLNANATRSCSECFFSEVGVKIGNGQACVIGIQRGLMSCYLVIIWDFDGWKNKLEEEKNNIFLTRHSNSRAGRAMMKRSFFTNSVTKVNSELSERLYAWETQTERKRDAWKLIILIYSIKYIY